MSWLREDVSEGGEEGPRSFKETTVKGKTVGITLAFL